MIRSRIVQALGIAVTVSACAGSVPGGSAPEPRRVTPADLVRADGGRPPYTRADVEFLSGMIPHHAQAVLMAGWALTHGASPTLQALAERIAVAQRDEIAFMRRWLGDRSESVPSGDPSHAHHATQLMPGMLTAEQLGALDRARGAEFDRLFLTFMIQHHQGALTMVERLFSAPGAAHDEDVFKFASDVHADQTTEIDFMGQMLSALGGERREP